MTAFVLRRLLMGVATLAAAVLISFLLVHAGSGSPGAVVLGPSATPEAIAAKNAELGWDDPLLVQLGDYVGGLLTGDLGVSLADSRSIADDMAARLPVTASIAALATLASGILGVLLGVTAAVRGGWVRRLATTGAGIGLSLPQFWVGVVLTYVLAIRLGLVPATGYTALGEDPAGWARSLVLPVLTLAVGGAAIVARTATTGLEEALRAEHVRTLRAMGTPEWKVRYVHALRYASVPVVSVLGIQFIVLFGGSIIIEQLFALPGLGQAAAAAVSSKDAPVVQAVVIVATLVVVLVNLALDLVVAALDPKVRTA
ncbi:ABC transporter permease [Nocardioides bruguierae]|uniref:ABC transporter permease n=1 Tax=Nocardioides bruguierae TaxID=2945102 RepID=A0A9X2IF29_9ACTN|nr:ABC transporter permease [Nocardioides bruguierae]MCM0621426.1 ABC transporter permease [Nocardioides bruguierae]